MAVGENLTDLAFPDNPGEFSSKGALEERKDLRREGRISGEPSSMRIVLCDVCFSIVTPPPELPMVFILTWVTRMSEHDDYELLWLSSFSLPSLHTGISLFGLSSPEDG